MNPIQVAWLEKNADLIKFSRWSERAVVSVHFDTRSTAGLTLEDATVKAMRMCGVEDVGE